MQQSKHFNLFVIGGGSGGLSCSRAAAALGAKVGLADFVKPSPVGTKWGIGGTCVNVGCIPKKLFHYTALLGEAKKDQQYAGWKVDADASHSWEQALQKINDHIKSLNFGYRKSLTNEKVTYFNKLAKFKSKNEIELVDADGNSEIVTADHVVIAVGGRPTYPDIPGAKEYGITSDDIFWQEKPPGKTLLVGASYISLECAGFLRGLGFDVTVMVRSILLRGFDQHIAEKVGQHMQQMGVKFVRKAVPTKIQVNSQGKRVVTYKQGEDEIEDQFDTVLFAIGRTADTHGLNLEAVGINTAKNGKIIANDDDTTNVPNIYALGDVAQGRLQLTPTAIHAGRLLADRLFGKSTTLMDYRNVATTVFTPVEYGCVGYSHEDAIAKFGEQNILAYGSLFKPLQWSINYERTKPAYAKLIVNKADKNRVIGLHFVGPNAGQVTQGFALGIRMGATKEDFDSTIGIHPTCAQEFTTMSSLVGSAGEQKTGC